MSARRTERLVNLVFCLLSTRRFLSAAQIREGVTSYADAPTEEAFRRTFERDKEDLRELGIPLETGTNSAADEEPGYRIARGRYELPPIALEPDEAAAVGMAARFWRSAALAEPAARAWLKLRAGDPAPPGQLPLADLLEPAVATPEPAFGPLLEAVRAGRSVRFPYRPVGAARTGDRDVDPWGVVCWRGHWYLVGHDRGRQDRRVFRLARITGPVRIGGPVRTGPPPEVDLLTEVASVSRAQPTATARLRLREGRGLQLRQEASAVDGSEVTVPYGETDRMAARIAGYGADVVVLDPPELREAVVALLRAAASA